MKDRYILAWFVTLRLVSVWLVKTWYVPDEYWQSLEVAHNVAFGYGYLTWEWMLGIRSYFYPLVIALLYKILDIFYLDNALAVIYLPRILQALLSAYADFRFYKWTGSRWAIFNISTSWFWFYCGSRTIINSFETALTTIALSYYPWPGKVSENSNKFIWIVAPLCFIRPTAAIPWLPLCLYHFLISNEGFVEFVLNRYVPAGITALVVSTKVDWWGHGSLVVTSYEFLKANVMNGVGEWYGSQPWHWYLSTGFPAILGIQLISFALGAVDIIKAKYWYRNELAHLACIVFTIFIYSLLPHKEFRFILPILPIALYISTDYLRWWTKKNEVAYAWAVAIVILIGNVGPAWYLSAVHQRGTLDVMKPLRKIVENNPGNTTLLFLMPCHSTPLYSHLHVNVSARFLTCEPNLKQEEHYVDEADEFYDGPNWWVRKHYPPSGPLPSHIITFDNLIPALSDVLSRYKPIYRIFHTDIPSGRVGRYVIIHQRVDY